MAETPARHSGGLDELIGAIYDCVIDPSRWHDTVDRIRHRYGLYSAILAVNDADNAVVLHVVVNVPGDLLPVIATHAADVPHIWGGWARVAAFPLEEPVFQSTVRPDDWRETGYYRHFIEPQGISDSIVIILSSDIHTIANLSFGVHGSAPPLTEAQVDELRILAPHIRRAVLISRMLDASMSAASSFAKALDAASAGIILVDAQRRIVHANRSGAAMLAAGDPIRQADGMLELVGEVVPGVLQHAIATAAEASFGSKGMGVPARARDGTPLTLQVMPLARRHAAPVARSAVAAVFIAEAANGPATSAEILGILFDLTPAEARIFALIASGQSIAQIAAELSISPATAKTHLARIYSKTGQRSRAQLVRLAQEVALPA